MLQIFVGIFLIFDFCSVAIANDTYSLKLIQMSMNYTEYDIDDTSLDSEHSNEIAGYEISYGFDVGSKEHDAKLTFIFSYLTGNAVYDGSYLISNEPVTGTTQQTIYNSDIQYSRKITMNYFDFTQRIGLGYHAWYRELSLVQDELYSWFYITPSLGIEKMIRPNIMLAVVGRYKYAIKPTMQANDIETVMRLGETSVVEVSIPFVYSINKKLSLSAEAVASLQTIGRSNYVSGTIDGQQYDNIHEPRSKDYQTYLKFGMTFNY